VVYPNPAPIEDPIHVSFKLNQPADYVTIQVWTPANRRVYTHKVTGPFSVGLKTVTLDLPQLKLANGLYYVVIRLPNGKQSIGKWVTGY
jgi:hypothetical protein